MQQNYKVMKYSIAFRNLPFVPETRQVIYVENQHDERINSIIRGKYHWLKWTFKQANLDFVYLPMFFNDEEIKEKVLYYAPYLTEEIMEKVELRSSHLLKYMSHLENQGKIAPSFLYAPKKDDEEWVFQGVTIDIDGSDNEITKWFENTVSEIEEELASPIRFQKAVKDSGPKIRFQKVEEDTYTGMANEPSLEETQAEYSSTPDFWEKAIKEVKKFGKSIVEEDSDYRTCRKASQPSLDEILDEDVSLTLEELNKNIERLRLLGIPLDVLIEYIAKYETISKLRITDDFRIFLPDYNNKEVRLTPLFKAVYFLFLNHPEGIILQRLEEHHREFANYYIQTSNVKELTPRMAVRINALEYPGNNYLNTIISKIKAEFLSVIDEHLAKHYYIFGRPGEPYKIALDYDYIEWE